MTESNDTKLQGVDTQRKGRILLAAGGTGGHIYPAVALAEAINKLAPHVELRFCCGDRPAEWQIYRRMKFAPWVVPVTHHRPGFAETFKFTRQMLEAWKTARRYLKAEPVQVAVGFGSYVSVMPLLAARLGGARLAIHEQNILVGKANRILAPLCKLIGSAVEPPQKGLNPEKTHFVGNPVRSDLLQPVDRAEALSFFRLKPGRPVCLCLGGSQGAAGINRILLGLLERLKNPENPAASWQLLWSTGTANYESIMSTLKDMGIDPEEHSINPYIDEMARAYAAADLVVGRAGALTISELTSLGRPAVMIPLPTAAGGHQAMNARRMVKAGAAEMIEEAHPQAAVKLEEMLTRWADAPDILEKMAQASLRQGRPDAAREMARLVLDLLPN